ncbi:cysteine desulfurase-like protein [Catelliglobosispora koreensis]|uniref:cysteine desulfurase-like protein n=1 Tax=Catelliglobosispora koreensis TaxID=129052 RepID=UPI00058ECDD5|nr:cysteine desulfurase-like protein [Catelliglobosispora koreensis]
MTLDIARVRAAYPALNEGFAHFDAAAGSLVAAPVAEAAHGVYTSAVANRTDAFEPGRKALRIVEQAREAVADLLGAQPSGVVFGSSATSLTYHISQTLAATWQPGDEVVVSRLDHDANVRPWVQAAAAVGATVRWAEFDASGALPVAQYSSLVGERTRVVALTAGSNANGAIPDVAAVSAIARAHGALCYVDGVHATPHVPVDVSALGADFYVTSAYKWSGPHLATCVASPSLWESLRPLKLMPSSDAVPERFELGTPSFASLAALTAAVDHLASLVPSVGTRRSQILTSMTAVRAYEMSLFAELVSGLASLPRVTLVPAPADSCPTLSFRVHNQHPAETAKLLGDKGVCVYSGDYYAYEFFSALGLRESGGAVRAGIYHYTTRDDITRLLDALA